MPYEEVYREPDLFLEYEGEKVYHAYNGNTYCDPMQFWYQIEIESDEELEQDDRFVSFDVRRLPIAHPTGDHKLRLRTYIDVAHDTGITLYQWFEVLEPPF